MIAQTGLARAATVDSGAAAPGRLMVVEADRHEDEMAALAGLERHAPSHGGGSPHACGDGLVRPDGDRERGCMAV
jgi:hypothetical protein